MPKKNETRKKFNHVNCSDDELSGKYFENALVAETAMREIRARSWTYQVEFAMEMLQRCKNKMGEDENMMAALGVYQVWYASHIFQY